jgi:PAS domain S-box-containing protein
VNTSYHGGLTAPQGVLEASFEEAPSGRLLLTLDGEICRANRAFGQLLGRTTAQLVGQGLRGLCHAEDQRGLATSLDRLQRGELGGPSLTVRFRRADGSPAWATLHLVRLSVDGCLLAEVHDATELHQLQAELRREHLAPFSRLIDGVSHDLNGALASIRAAADLVLAEIARAPELREDVEVIRQSAERAALLIRRFGAFRHRPRGEPQPLDLSQVLRGAESLLRSALGARVELEMTLASGLPSVVAEIAELEALLVSLVLVAGQAIGESGWLRVETRKEAERSVLVLSDSGPSRELEPSVEALARELDAQLEPLSSAAGSAVRLRFGSSE